MNILVTGATGFIGRMVMEILNGVSHIPCDGRNEPIDTIFAADLDPSSLNELVAADPRVVALPGDFASETNARTISANSPGLVIHLASVVSGAAEADYDLGLTVNLLGLIRLLSLCQTFEAPPVFVFTSSVAVFSATGNGALLDTDVPMPLSSYGAQKLAGEILVRDAARRRIVRGRSIRFPTIAVRPGAPNKAASSFVSGIIREPLAGLPAVLPVDTSVRLFLASPESALASILHAAALPQSAIGSETTLTLPGISVTVEEMIDSLRRIAGEEVAARIRHERSPTIEAIVGTWPGSMATPRAQALGFPVDRTIDDMIRLHIHRIGAKG